LQAQPDHGAAVGLAGTDHYAQERQDKACADDVEACRRTERDPASSRTAGVLPARREGHLREHAAKLDAAGASSRRPAGDERRAHPAAHVLLAPGDAARRAGTSRSWPDTPT